METVSIELVEKELYEQKNKAWENVRRCDNARNLYERKIAETKAAMLGASAKDLRILQTRLEKLVTVLYEYKLELRQAKRRYGQLVKSRNNLTKQVQQTL